MIRRMAPYRGRLQHLGLFRLEKRIKGCIIQIRIILHGLDNMEEFFFCYSLKTQGHVLKITARQKKGNIFSHSAQLNWKNQAQQLGAITSKLNNF